MEKSEITRLRRRIDRLDRKLTRLLLKRYDNVRTIGKIKKNNSAPVVDEKREREILDKIATLKTESGCKAYIRSIYVAIFHSSRGLEDQEKREEWTKSSKEKDR